MGLTITNDENADDLGILEDMKTMETEDLARCISLAATELKRRFGK